MRIKECKEWESLPIEIREILLENQKLLNKYLIELENEKSERLLLNENQKANVAGSTLPSDSKFSKSKEKAGVRKDANIE